MIHLLLAVIVFSVISRSSGTPLGLKPGNTSHRVPTGSVSTTHASSSSKFVPASVSRHTSSIHIPLTASATSGHLTTSIHHSSATPSQNLSSGLDHASDTRSTESAQSQTTSTTSVQFMAPSGATLETFVASGTTQVISIPSATTVLPLGPPVLSTVQSLSTVLNASHTITQTFFSTATHIPAVTLGPGGEVVGPMPTSVSQPGFMPPVFNNNPIPPPGATVLTFTGPAGYSTTVPVPTSASSTILVGAMFGGGSIVLGVGGTIIGTLPEGISEVGGTYPVPTPPSPQGDPTHHSLHSTSMPSHSLSSSSTSPSPSSCPQPEVPTCGEVCDPDDADQYFYDSDSDEDDEDSPSRRWADYIPGAGLVKRAKKGRHIQACGKLIVSKSKNGVKKFQGSGPRQYFEFSSQGKTNSFDITQSKIPGSKPLNAGYKTEHLFEFQTFSRFMNDFVSAKNQLTCKSPWFATFFAPTTTEVQDTVNRIDSIPNLVYTNDYINTAKKLMYRTRRSQKNSWVLTKFIEQLSKWQNGRRWADADARKKLALLMRGFGAVPQYLNLNANAIKSTAEDIIAILQRYERRTGTVFTPPIAVQFYDFYVSEINDFQRRGESLGAYLARAFSDKMAITPFPCQWIFMPAMQLILQTSYPTMPTTSLIPTAPLCFPDGSAGKIAYPAPDDLASLGVKMNYPTMPTTSLIPTAPLCFPDGSAGKIAYPAPDDLASLGVKMKYKMTIVDATANGPNIKVNLHYANDPLAVPGWNYLPTQVSSPGCQGVYIMTAAPTVPGNPLWDFDCTTQELSIAVSGTSLNFCGMSPAFGKAWKTGYYCASSETQFQTCINQFSGGIHYKQAQAVWTPVPA
ncbi:hypothetical protein DFH09DRAFT_1087399 [Mycena vulgaris]|nr:hypothetical protein DFH09DRAFT_1087399 [Mycena vulgaris]